MQRLTFAGNSAKNGGALLIDTEEGRSCIADCRFVGNRAEIQGGAISCRSEPENVMIINSEFVDNVASGLVEHVYGGTVVDCSIIPDQDVP